MENTALPSFPLLVQQNVAWGDMDAFGHVNNTIYMRYFESARIKYFDRMPGMQGFQDHIKPVLASISGQFKYPVVYPDQLQIYVGVKKLGNASLTMGCEMFSSHGFLAFVGECTIVMVDFDKNPPTPVRIPEAMRGFIEQAEGRSFQ